MSNYIITSDGELMHYGVPGMKWGKRKIAAYADRNIRAIKRDRAIRDVNYKYDKNELKVKYGGKPKKAKKMHRKTARITRRYENDKAVFDYKIAKNKAFKDPSYRKTAEYHDAVSRGKSVVRTRMLQELVFGIVVS